MFWLGHIARFQRRAAFVAVDLRDTDVGDHAGDLDVDPRGLEREGVDAGLERDHVDGAVEGHTEDAAAGAWAPVEAVDVIATPSPAVRRRIRGRPVGGCSRTDAAQERAH